MKTLAIVCGAGYVSGKEIMTLELSEGLRARDYQLEIVTTLWGNGDLWRRLKTSGFSVHQLWLGFISATLAWDCVRMTGEQMIRWPHLLLGYRRFLHSVAPERVIHTNWHHLLLLWPFLKPGRDLFWLHEVVPNKPQYRRVFGWLAPRLGGFVCVSNAVARALAEIGIASDKIRVIHNGLKDPAVEAGSREQGAGAVRIGIIGQVGDWKGHDDLFEAFGLIAKSHSTAEMYVFGRGTNEYERHLKELADALGIADRIVWRGHVADRAEIYRELSACVVPSRSQDPLPTVAIEAGFFGIPVVATRRGGLPEIIDDGVTGFLVEAGQPKELAARLDELLKSPELRRRMGKAARQRVETHFSRERFVDEFTKLLENKGA